MRVPLRWLVLSVSGLVLMCGAGGGRLLAADAPESKRVSFTTVDEVELSGNLYPAMPGDGKGAKDAVVLLLHDFKHDTGGGSRQTVWIDLAGRLQKEGYAVLAFDFRGFGDSKSVSANFWKVAFNKANIKRKASGRELPATIDQKDFTSLYYLTLVNDIAAARAKLNVASDNGTVNASNIIVIGAGQGATLGALWMASECRRQRDPLSNRLPEGRLPDWRSVNKKFDDPEGNDIRAAVWLSITPSVEGYKQLGGTLRSCLVDAARSAKIPTLFLRGQKDETGADLAKAHLAAITNHNGKRMELKNVKAEAVKGTGTLGGAKLLDNTKTIERIVGFVNNVIEDRGVRTRRDYQDKQYAFCWTLPWPDVRGAAHVLAKLPGADVPRLIDPRAMNRRR